ncbi:MAG: DUF2905 domain-containing protein [Chloroflexi bacterium]|nr:DUF2905 domain-containing protein [Chloroflexota bacterium]
MDAVGKLLLGVGAFLVLLGLLIIFKDRIPYVGRLPGDIVIRGKGFTLYFPLATAIIISMIVSIIFSLLWRK